MKVDLEGGRKQSCPGLRKLQEEERGLAKGLWEEHPIHVNISFTPRGSLKSYIQ
jgi:hypothetical protein